MGIEFSMQLVFSFSCLPGNGRIAMGAGLLGEKEEEEECS